MGHLLILVPFTRKGYRHEVFDALRHLPVGATVAPWELKDEAYGYGRVLRSLWRKCAETRTDLCIIEQDNLVERPSQSPLRREASPQAGQTHALDGLSEVRHASTNGSAPRGLHSAPRGDLAVPIVPQSAAQQTPHATGPGRDTPEAERRVEAGSPVPLPEGGSAGRSSPVLHDGETAGTIAGFIRCPDWWCAHSYEVAPRPDVRGVRGQSRDIATAYGGPYGLGCVRFRWQLMRAEPDLIDVALSRAEHPGFPAGHYLGLDSAVTGTLRGRVDQRTGQRDDGFARAPRYDAHQHFPNVAHLHAYAEPVGHAVPA